MQTTDVGLYRFPGLNPPLDLVQVPLLAEPDQAEDLVGGRSWGADWNAEGRVRELAGVPQLTASPTLGSPDGVRGASLLRLFGDLCDQDDARVDPPVGLRC